MTEQALAEKRLVAHHAQASKAFATHVVTKSSDRRWLLQQIHADGKPDWTFAAEIIVLEGGGLFVGGDIDHVVFAYGPREPRDRLRWMGECKDLGYYVAQKARVGMGREVVDVWAHDIACDELRAHVADLESQGESLADPESIEDALEADNREDFCHHAAKALGGSDAWETVGDMGEYLAPRVVYAHAALARLCVLLREAEAAKPVAEVAHV